MFRFVDLFAGIGGFHAALSSFGGRCEYAVEMDKQAASVYRANWGINPLGDITLAANDDRVIIPDHDVLAAGFPCQPFSKSGAQRGMDEARGTLFWNIARVIEERRPAMIILENVRNIAGPRHVHEWHVIIDTLRQLGYRVSDEPAICSPHHLPPERGGTPQSRERVFITASRIDDASLSLTADPVAYAKPLDGWNPQDWNLESDLPLDDDVQGYELSDNEMHWINAWDEFVTLMLKERNGERLPGFPFWVDEWVTMSELNIPAGTPKWKAGFLTKNAQFYTDSKAILDKWIDRWSVMTFPPSRRKFEWQAQDATNLWDCVMHLRPSGIRAKRATYLPALVAITQTSIIGSRKRRISTREAARLQGLPDWFDFGDQPASATYRQLGNAVNVGAVQHVMRQHVLRDRDILQHTAPHLVHSIVT